MSIVYADLCFITGIGIYLEAFAVLLLIFIEIINHKPSTIKS